MKRFAMLAFVLMFAISCDDSPTSPSDPNVALFTSILLPGNEVPAVTNADVAASGTLQLQLDLTRDAGNAVTGGTANFTVHMTGFPNNTVLTGAHSHAAPAGTNAGVFLNTGLATGELTLATGQQTFTKTVTVSAAQANAIINNPAGHYFNVHTTLNPGGAIRGQLVRSN